jgi:hypothetical protein
VPTATDEASTIAALEQHSRAVADAISTMGHGITGVDDAASALRSVANEQFAVVAALTEKVTDTLVRVDSLSGLTEQLERRHHRRVPVTGPVTLTCAGRDHPAGSTTSAQAACGPPVNRAGPRPPARRCRPRSPCRGTPEADPVRRTSEIRGLTWPREDVHHGDHGEEEAAGSSFVHV